jgi:hypothetical protein
MVRCGVHRDVHGRENYVLFGFTLICFVEVNYQSLLDKVRVPLVEQELLALLDHSSSRRLIVGFKKEQYAMTYKALHRKM